MTPPASATGGARAPAARDAGEFAFSDRDFKHIAKLLRGETGISLSTEKGALVYSRLAKRLRALGLKSFKQYCALLESPEGGDELNLMISALTTNVTRFYREPHHFEHLKTHVLEPIAENIKRGGRLRLWSAACSSGEEPYTMALTILSVLPEAPSLDVRILATDIDPVVVEKGRRGVYPATAVEPIPTDLRRKYLSRQSDGQYSLGDAPRALIAFKTLNLLHNWPMRGPFQAIICRNVVIYFEEETQNQIWSKFNPLLDNGGRLYVGHSERVAVPGFKLDGVTTYQKTVVRAGA